MPPGDAWTLVTVTHNSSKQLRTSWAQASYGNARWVVIDNASTDDSATIAQGLGAEVIKLDRNVGFGRANNVALGIVDTPWVGFVNPDVTIPEPTGLDRLAAVSAANRGALVAPQLLNPDGTEQPNARGLPYVSDKLANRLGRFPGARLSDYVRTGLSHPTHCAWVIGAALAGPMSSLREIGFWDQHYFIYYEDHDIGLRSWEAGHPVVLDPAVRWVHEWQRATMHLRWAPWRHELASARRFYRTYPELRTRLRGTKVRPALADLSRRVWSVATEPSPH